ncbi:hypothetical protein LCGC14_1171410 [marine sediment metagenome]|uniref:Uncharacterized protein n=1 Tax=marine sediment metagenome TaxID=412755 RepID=A0A0F9LUK6_9ZZZZ
MRFDTFLIGLALFSLTMFVGFAVVQDMSDQYGLEGLDGNLTGGYDINQEMADLSLAQKGKMFGSADEDVGFLDSMIGQAKGVFDLLTSPIRLVYNLMDNVSKAIGVPAIFVKTGNTILTLSIIFGIAYLYFRIRSW